MATFKPLIADSLCVAYGKADVLNSVHVEINPGEITCLLGSNGAGKTTFIRALTGLTKPHAGTIQFDGLEITGLPPHRIVSMGISCIPEGRRVFPAMNVEENLLMGAYQERDRNRIRERLARVYDLFPRLKDLQSGALTHRSIPQHHAVSKGTAVFFCQTSCYPNTVNFIHMVPGRKQIMGKAAFIGQQKQSYRVLVQPSYRKQSQSLQLLRQQVQYCRSPAV